MPSSNSGRVSCVLGAAFDHLPPSVRALHSVDGRARFAGRAQVERGTHPLAALCALCTRLPRPGRDVAITIDFTADAHGETWQRHFGNARMTSHLRAQRGLLVERLGLLQFRFALSVVDDAIHWRLAGARLLGVLPLPLVGRVMRYEGWLAPA